MTLATLRVHIHTKSPSTLTASSEIIQVAALAEPRASDLQDLVRFRGSLCDVDAAIMLVDQQFSCLACASDSSEI